MASSRWRDRALPGNGRGSGTDRSGASSSALERIPTISLQGRIARAVRAPVVAGAAVFVVAVIVAIGIAVASSLGGDLAPGDGAVAANGESAGLSSGTGAEPSLGGGEADPRPATNGGAVAGGAADADAATPIFVHVVGAVHRAGVVELVSGARVRDAIEAAGGASDEAVLAGVNLARLVADGEQLLVPDEETVEAGAATEPAAGAAAGGAQPGGTQPDAGKSLVNLNTADATLLETLPRVGPALAGRIIDWRDANGGFASVDQLLEVTGIGAKTLAGFRDRVTV